MQNASDVACSIVPSAQWTTERLDSWKEIACFFRREVRTVQLWERSEGLPVRRQYHKKLGTVYAYRQELEAWWITRSSRSSCFAQRCDEGYKRSAASVTATGTLTQSSGVPEPKLTEYCSLPCRVNATRTMHPEGVEHGPAYHARMMGLHFWKQRTATDLMRAVGYYQDAIQCDPCCADAYAGLADTYISLSYNHVVPPRQAADAAQRAVAAALKLAPTSRNVRHSEINLKINCTWDWQTAERACRELMDQGGSDARTLQLYAGLMINFGRHDEAITLALDSLRFDPLSDSLNSLVSFAYFYAGDYDSALLFIQRAIELKPRATMGHALLGRTEAERGNWDAAIQAFERGLEQGGDSTFLKALLAYGYAGSGDAFTANGILGEIEQERGNACFPAYDVSAVHAILNQENQALEDIAQAYAMRDIKMTWMQHDPRFHRLRGLAQFQQIASSVHACARQD